MGNQRSHEAGDIASAERNFNRSFANAHLPFDVWTETPSGGAINFITGVGGFLQTVLFGLSGLRILSDHLDLDPVLLEGMDGIRIRGIHYRGSTIDMEWNAHTMTLHCKSGIIVLGNDKTLE